MFESQAESICCKSRLREYVLDVGCRASAAGMFLKTGGKWPERSAHGANVLV
jgi:hypothetical protein